jgi:hypothetical protein
MDLNATDARGRPAHPSTSSHHGRSPTPGPSGSSSNRRTGLPPLSPAKRAELMANNGCFRCQKNNAGHIARNCPGISSNVSRPRPQSPAAAAPSRSRSSSPGRKN